MGQRGGSPDADLVVIGGGLGGVAAALTAARLGQRVILTEAAPWLGGQLTSQGVPPDEHPWIEGPTTSPSYAELRSRIRDHYRRNYPLTSRAAAWEELNPGLGNVSRLCHEPRVGALAIEEMLSPLVASGTLTVLRPFVPVAVSTDGDRIEAVVVEHRLTGEQLNLTGSLVVDATELGDVLALGGVEHVYGAESADETGELHAPAVADPMDQQAITWCAALEWCDGEDHTIEAPVGYAHWRDTVDPRWPGPQLSWEDVVPYTLGPRHRPLFPGDPLESQRRNDGGLWHFRRILGRQNLRPEFPGGEITLVNWPQVDYWEKPLLGVDDAARASALAGARELTLSFVHWMQTEAPRHGGGRGYPELRLRGDAMGTVDGLAQEAYIRESRRIRALFTVTEAHIGRSMRPEGEGAEVFADSVGIGYYRIDLHPSTSGRSYVDIDCLPFQVPLGALVPRRVTNLLAANKNIGTTHITNGAYRLHPVEWAIGEAVGALSVVCADERTVPRGVWESPALTAQVQHLLSGRLGVTLHWPERVRTGAPPHDSVPLPDLP